MQPNTKQNSYSENAERIASAMERILRPVIKLFVGRISCGFMVLQIKRIYIEEARKWIEKNDANSRVTKSKLAMLTGLDTRTIAAIENSHKVENIEDELCAETAVLSRWVSQPEFVKENEPKLLPILGRKGSFQSLVSSTVGRNVTYQTVLDRLLESGNVEIVDDDYVKLINAYYQPIKPSEQIFIDFGSRSVARLTNTVVHNMHSKDPAERKLQQDRWSRFVPEESLTDLGAEIRVLLEAQILDIEKIISKYEVPESESGVCKFGVGWFVFS